MTRAPFDPHRCYYCAATDERQALKPLGPGRAPVCLSCVTDPAHPEREEAAKAMYLQSLQEAPRSVVIRLDVQE